MGTIREKKTSDGATRFQAIVRLKGTPTQTKEFQRKTDAKRWIQHVESAIRDGRNFTKREDVKHTLADLIDRYTRDVTPTKKSGAKQDQQLAWWRGQLGVYFLKDVTPALVAETRDKLAATPTPRGEPRSGASVNRYLAALSHAFTVAVREWGWLDSSPVVKVSRRKEAQGRVRYLVDDERARLLAACADGPAYLRPVVGLALATGMRQGEILGLRWPDVDLTRAHLTLHDTKNGDRRGVPLAGAALADLREWAKVRRLDDDRVFPGTSNFRRAWMTAVRRAGLDDFRFHDLRHSCASYLAMNGATPSELAAILGHKTLAMVKRYAHVSDAHLRGVLESMNKRFLDGGQA